GDLDIQNHGMTLWDLDRTFPTGGFGGRSRSSLRDILGLLRDSYCRTVGVEYMHLADRTQRKWLQERLEAGYAKTPREDQLRILRRLNSAEAFETFLQTKFVGQKRFSLEGGESLIPLLDAILSKAAENGLDEVGIGMAHRGRLNVLANIAGKSYAQIFAEFEGQLDPKSVQGSGDVKYHLGTEGTFTSESGATTRVYLAANPSHLEAVDPVLEASSGPSRTASTSAVTASPCCRSWCTATRPSRARASCPRCSTCRSCAGTAPAARSTWSSTTRSASPRARRRPARRRTRPTWPRATRCRSCT